MSNDPTKQWVEEFIARLSDGSLHFEPDQLSEVNDHLAVIQDKLLSANPKPGVLRASMRSFGRLLEEAGGGVIAQGLLAGLPVVIAGLT